MLPLFGFAFGPRIGHELLPAHSDLIEKDFEKWWITNRTICCVFLGCDVPLTSRLDRMSGQQGATSDLSES
jgi:hypothetical protein